MVRGLDVFRDFFADYRDCYVLIGGSACDVYFTDQEIPFRVTHDLDAPTEPGYPAMLELFARKADFLSENAEVHLTPIPAGEEASSLSGILLDQTYYDFVMSNRREIDGVTVLEPIALIILKAVAWLDLTVKKEQGDTHAYGKDISKHKNDIARIVATIPVRDYALPDAIKAKMREFMVRYVDAEIDVSALGVPLNAADVKQQIAVCLGLSK